MEKIRVVLIKKIKLGNSGLNLDISSVIYGFILHSERKLVEPNKLQLRSPKRITKCWAKSHSPSGSLFLGPKRESPPKKLRQEYKILKKHKAHRRSY